VRQLERPVEPVRERPSPTTVTLTPPRLNDPEALIKEARARQVRRRLLGAACVASVAALGLSVYSVTAGHEHHAANVSQRVQAPVCRAAQLSASFSPGGAAGITLGGLVIANASGRSCSVPATRPTVQVTIRGRTLSARQRSWGPDQQFGPRAGPVLRPGTRAYFEIGWRNWCPNPAASAVSRHATLLLRFRGGLRLAVPETAADRGVSVPGCGEAVHPAPWIAVSPLLRYR